MSRYPFTDCLNEYIPAEDGHLSTTTIGSTRRHLANLGTIFKKLKNEGKVSSDNPRKITARDIDVLMGYRKSEGISNDTRCRDLSYLKKLLLFFDNNAVDEFKVKFPAHVPKRTHKRKESMEEPAVQVILDHAREVSIFDWKLSEAYGVVTLAICTGLRPKELRMMYLSNVHIDGDTAEVFAEHVKGEGSYGEPRWVPVHPDGVPLLKKYLEARKFKLDLLGKRSDVLFPPLKSKNEFISYNYLQKLKGYVEEEIGMEFNLYKCRRTFGQRAIDEGQDLHDVSLVMGHASLDTTQKYYCDKKQHLAAKDMNLQWQNRNAEVKSEDA